VKIDDGEKSLWWAMSVGEAAARGRGTGDRDCPAPYRTYGPRSDRAVGWSGFGPLTPNASWNARRFPHRSSISQGSPPSAPRTPQEEILGGILPRC